MIRDKHYFHFKGKNAEEALADLAYGSFLKDWCFPSPKNHKGKEICDLLVLFDNIAIVWQIKDLKLTKDELVKEKHLEKNVRQAYGAEKALLNEVAPISLENTRRRIEKVDPKKIDEVFLISCFMGQDPVLQHLVEQKGKNKRMVHIFNRSFTELVLSELDTIQDFTNYLRAKESLLLTKDSIVISGGEQELLACYLKSNKSFDEFEVPQGLFIEEGLWTDFVNSQRYKNKLEANSVSYGWDEIIDRIHEGSENYEEIARHIARPTRFQRRGLAKTMLDAWIKAHKTPREKGDHYRRLLLEESVTYVFLFVDEKLGREKRQEMLRALCIIARGVRQEKDPHVKEVIGIASEKEIKPTCSYDFLHYIVEEWTPQEQAQYEDFQRLIGAFKNVHWVKTTEHEYPD